MQQRLIIKKTYIDFPQQLSDKLKELKQQVDANAEPLKKTNANLAALREQRTKLEAEKAHAEIEQLKRTISTLERSIAANKEEKRKLADELGEKSRIVHTLNNELRLAIAEHQKAKAILAEYDAVKPQLDLLEAKRLEYQNKLQSSTVPDSEAAQPRDEIKQINAAINTLTGEMAMLAVIVEKKGEPHFFTTKNQALTIDEIRAELKQLEANEHNCREKCEQAQREVDWVKSGIVEQNESITKKQDTLSHHNERLEYLIQQCDKESVEHLIQQHDTRIDKEDILALENRLSILQNLILVTTDQATQLEAPAEQYELKKLFQDRLINNRVYQQLLDDPRTLLKNLSQAANNHIILGRKTKGDQPHLTEFQRLIDEISSTAQIDSEEKQDDDRIAIREKCFQLCALFPFGVLFPNLGVELDKEDCEAAYSKLRETLELHNTNHPESTPQEKSDEQLYIDEKERFSALLKTFDSDINQCKQTKKLSDSVNELVHLSALSDAEYRFCADVLRTATLRIQHPDEMQHKTNLDNYAKEIKHEQANSKSIRNAKILGILSAVVLLASIIAISALTLGAAAPAIPLAAKLVCSIGCFAGAFGMFAANKKNKNAQAKGDAKKIFQANDAIEKLHKVDFFNRKNLLPEVPQDDQDVPETAPLSPRLSTASHGLS